MKRRIVLALTAVTLLVGGAGLASAASKPLGSPVGASVPNDDHQLCVLVYKYNDPDPEHICINW